jgi:predicted N-acyltransferase
MRCPPCAHLTTTRTAQVSAEDWDACATGDGTLNPFLLHAFLLALETSRSAVRCRNAFRVAYVPAYSRWAVSPIYTASFHRPT